VGDRLIVQIGGTGLFAGKSLGALDRRTGEVLLTYDLAAPIPAIDGQNLLSAIVAGESLQLPEFALEMSGAVDLATRGRTVPGALAVTSHLRCVRKAHHTRGKRTKNSRAGRIRTPHSSLEIGQS
jgi:hypothetical protein